MSKISYLDFKKKSAAGLILGVIALLVGVAALILFLATKEAEFTKQMIETYHQDLYVTLALIAGIALSGITIIFDGKFLKYLGFIAYLFALLNYFVFEADYLGNLFSSIDPTALTAEFVVLIALLAAATLTAFLSAVLTKERISNGKGGNEA